MEFVKTLLYLVICQSAGIITTADDHLGHRAENVRWVSLDFKTIVIWTSKGSDQKFTVLFSEVDDEIWRESLDCTEMSHTQCDLSNDLRASDRTYLANILTEAESDYGDPEALPHTHSPHFNPYKQSNISSATFTVEALDDGQVRVNITDPLTTLHNKGKQLNIRDVFKNELKYKISYYKAGNTRKRDFISDSSVAHVPNLDAGESYCFMVAAYIPSRPRDNQLGAWSKQPQCTEVDKTVLQELSLGAWVGIAFIVLTVLIVIIIVTVLCCKCCPRRKTLHTSQTSTPI